MATLSDEVYGRVARMRVFGAEGGARNDLEDHFHRLAAMADGQRGYLQP